MVYILFQWCLLFFNVVSFTSVKTAVAFASQRRSPQWAWPSTSSSCSSSAVIVDYTSARYGDKNGIKTNWKAALSFKLAVEGNHDDSIVSITEKSKSLDKKNQPMIGVYLLSFPNLYPNGSTENTTGSFGDAGNTASNWRKKIKQWKQYCLGDGGVYFDERPETLKALNVLLCKTIRRNLEKDERQQSDTLDSDATNVKSVEVAVVSTCARLEILIVVQYADSARIDGNILRDTVQRSILETILEQISYHQNRLSFRLQNKLPFNLFDRPSRIWGNASHSKHSTIDGHLLNELSREVVLVEGVKDVSERLCLIAAGLLDRPLFRPFSSRDSHVMHQLKRSSICAVKSLNSHADQKPVNGTTKYCKTLIDTALQSGKGARSVKVVPILLELREVSNGANGPADLSARAAESAIDLAVRPAVSICISKFKAFQAAESIVGFRQNVEAFVENVTCGKLHLEDDSCANVRRLLHLATIKLREGKHVDMDEFLKDVASEISLLNLLEST